ncbi:thiamine ABC transporter substrate-binding protein [Halobaculum sp. D14]|uniref:thiamine ABC transporter substrate-binding protein n=1 Tax=Halobaculum sp. D14 TaxID=3421642 RepID=UPI003EC11AAA
MTRSRRQFLTAAGATGAALLAGCQAQKVDTETPTSDTPGGAGTTTGEPTPATANTLVVTSYPAFTNAPSSSPGAWLKRRFEDEFDATLVYKTPQNELNYYIERAAQGVDFEADVYIGLDVNALIRADEKRGTGQFTKPLFTEYPELDGASRIKENLWFDPKDRAVPFDTSYVSLVWNATKEGGEFVAPETFDELTKPAFEGDLITQNPTSAVTGKRFMLHTVKRYGEDGYLDYWEQLKQNGVQVLGNWSDSYSAYTSGEAPMVTSYSTDQVYANRYDQNMQKHQIRFLNDQAYGSSEGMARFRSSDAPELARKFMEFVLRPEIQVGIAKRNVSIPAITDAPLPEDYSKYAKVPPEPVEFSYQELKGNVTRWTDQWAKQFASN